MEVVRRVVRLIDNKQYRSIIFAIVLSIISAVALFKIVDLAFSKSVHPVTTLLMRLILGITFVIPFILRKKEIFIYYFILSFPFMRLAFNGIDLLAIYSFLLVAIYRKEIVNLVKGKENIYRIPFFIITLCFIYTSLLAKYPRAAFEKVLFYLLLGGIYYVLTAFIKSEREIKAVFRFLLMPFAFCILVSFLQFRFGINSIKFFFDEYNANTGVYGSFFTRRIPSVFVEAQAAGQYFATMIMLALGLLSTYFWKSKLIKGLLAIGALAFLLTISRAAILSFIGVMFVVHLFILSFRKVVILMLIVISMMAVIGMFYEHIMPSQIRERFDPHNQREDYNFRYALWKHSLPIIKHYPFGVGLGGGNLFYAGDKVKVKFTESMEAVPQLRGATHFENSYLDTLYSLGIIGFGGFILLLVKYFKTGVKLIKENPHPDAKRFSFYLMGAMAVWLIPAATSPQIEQVQPMIIFVTLLALMNSFNTIYRKP